MPSLIEVVRHNAIGNAVISRLRARRVTRLIGTLVERNRERRCSRLRAKRVTRLIG